MRVRVEHMYGPEKMVVTISLGDRFHVEGDSLMACLAQLDAEIRADFDAAIKRGYSYLFDSTQVGQSTWIDPHG